MQKIILSEKTLPLIIGRLNNFRGGVVKEDRLRDRTTVQGAIHAESYGSYTYGPTNVGVHPFVKNPLSSLSLNMGRKVLIYQQSHKNPMGIYHEGDVFYFVGNRMIITCVESHGSRPGRPKKRLFTRLTLLRSKKKVTEDERRNWEKKMKDLAAENRRYEEQYWAEQEDKYAQG